MANAKQEQSSALARRAQEVANIVVGSSLVTIGEHTFTEAEMQAITTMVFRENAKEAQHITADDVAQFIYIARVRKLNPLLGQIRCIYRWNSAAGRSVPVLQVSIDGFRAIADRSKSYAPGEKVTKFIYGEPDEILTVKGRSIRVPYSATVYIVKFVQGQRVEFSSTAIFDEYAQRGDDGKLQSLWGTHPHVMIAKCAETAGLRRGWPEDLSGLYAPEEMGNAGLFDVDHTVIDQQQATFEAAPTTPAQLPAPQPTIEITTPVALEAARVALKEVAVEQLPKEVQPAVTEWQEAQSTSAPTTPDVVVEDGAPTTKPYVHEPPRREVEFSPDHPVAKCRSCGAAIQWGKLQGRNHPFNLDGVSHFASCPDREDWRESLNIRKVEAPLPTITVEIDPDIETVPPIVEAAAPNPDALELATAAQIAGIEHLARVHDLVVRKRVADHTKAEAGLIILQMQEGVRENEWFFPIDKGVDAKVETPANPTPPAPIADPTPADLTETADAGQDDVTQQATPTFEVPDDLKIEVWNAVPKMEMMEPIIEHHPGYQVANALWFQVRNAVHATRKSRSLDVPDDRQCVVMADYLLSFLGDYTKAPTEQRNNYRCMWAAIADSLMRYTEIEIAGVATEAWKFPIAIFNTLNDWTIETDIDEQALAVQCLYESYLSDQVATAHDEPLPKDIADKLEAAMAEPAPEPEPAPERSITTWGHKWLRDPRIKQLGFIRNLGDFFTWFSQLLATVWTADELGFNPDKVRMRNDQFAALGTDEKADMIIERGIERNIKLIAAHTGAPQHKKTPHPMTVEREEPMSARDRASTKTTNKK